MNILMVGDSIPQDKPGGGGRYLCDLSQRLARSGHTVYILVQKHDAGRPFFEKTDGIHIYRFHSDKGGITFSLLDRLRRSRQVFEQICDEVKPDLVNIHFALAGFGIIRAARSRAIPCLYTFQGPWSAESLIEDGGRPAGKNLVSKLGGFYVKLYMEKAVFRHIDRFLVLSRFNRDILTGSLSIPADRVSIIPGAIETDRFPSNKNKETARSELGIPTGKPVLLTVRRLAARMGLENLIEAARIIADRREIILVIGGTGHLEDRLRSLAGRLGLGEYVRFAGQIPEEKLPLYYQAADLFVLPSLSYEGFGLVTIEALSSGIPVVATATGGSKEILENFDPRLLADPGSPESLAEKIMKALAGTEYDPPHLHQFAKDNYSWATIYPRVEELFATTAGNAAIRNQAESSTL